MGNELKRKQTEDMKARWNVTESTQTRGHRGLPKHGTGDSENPPERW